MGLNACRSFCDGSCCFNRTFPALANSCAISLMDITTVSKNIMTSEGSYLVFIPALVIYLVITAFFGFIFDKIEKKFSVYE